MVLSPLSTKLSWSSGVLLTRKCVPICQAALSFRSRTTTSATSRKPRQESIPPRRRKAHPEGHRPRSKTSTIVHLVLIYATCYGLYKISAPLAQIPRQLREQFNELYNASRQPEYQHLEPGQIRVIVIAPGNDGQPISCSLKHISLADKPGFEALSYVWGPPSAGDDIYCSGKKVPVGYNLFKALHNLRQPDRERVIWADAICINQGDTVEKSRQIKLMGQIYSKATQVLIWIGEPTETTENAFNTLKDLNAYFKARLWWYSETYSSIARRGPILTLFPEFTEFTHKQIDEVAAFDWRSVDNLFDHPWFKRVWVLQEFTKASKITVLHGRQELPFWSFVRPVAEALYRPRVRAVLKPHLDALNSGSTVLSLAGLIIFGTEGNGRRSGKLLDLVAEGSSRTATDPRDRVYAFLDIARDYDETDWELIPDYSVSAEEVYTRFARWCLLKKKDLSCLAYRSPIWHDRGQHNDLPSWVPDWRDQSEGGLYTKLHAGYHASSGSKPWISWEAREPSVLQIKGRIVDKIDEVSITKAHLMALNIWESSLNDRTRRELDKSAKKDGAPIVFLNALQDARDAIHRFGVEQTPKQALPDVILMENCKHIASRGTGKMSQMQYDTFWRAMVFDRDIHGGTRPKPGFGKTFLKYVTLLEDIRTGRKTTIPLTGVHRDLESREEINVFNAAQGTASRNSQEKWVKAVNDEETQLLNYMDTMWADTPHMRFCSTDEKRLGWVPLKAQAGDIICIFDGADLPFVLRPKYDKQGLQDAKEIRVPSKRLSISQLFAPQPQADDTVRYELIGDCYVHGIMSGEAMKMAHFKEQIFELW